MELVNRSKKNIFCFWESNNDLPAYLKLCIKTWKKNIKNSEVHIINYSNLHLYLSEEEAYEIELLKQIRLPMQSDILSAAILEKFGGLFMDVDCIVTADLFEIFNSISAEKLIGFGRGGGDKKSMHLAVLYSKNPKNPILTKWKQEAQIKLKNIPEPMDWSYFGNSILNPILSDKKFEKYSYIIDRSISGNILESTVLPNFDKIDPLENYRAFYFNEFIQISPEVVNLVSCGVISLHNSWTPTEYKSIYDTDEFLRQDIALSKFLNLILYSSENKRLALDNSLIQVEIYLRKILEEHSINYKEKYFKGALVYDFNISNNQFAFDIIHDQKKDKVSLFMVLRNIEPTELLKIDNFSNLNFDKNKVLLLKESDKNKIAFKILEMIKLLRKFIVSGLISSTKHDTLKENFLLNTLIEDKVFINILMMKIKNSKLFIEGEVFIEGCNVQEYNDINYTLELLNNQNKYEIPLAKLHKQEITKKYSRNSNIFYDKCYMTTYNHNGIDLSNIDSGKYKVFLKIKCKNIIKVQKLRTNNVLAFNDNNILELIKKDKYILIDTVSI